MLTRKQLKEKLFEYRSGWAGKQTGIARAGSTNIHVLTNKVISFPVYNMLPVDGSELDGQYTIFVNYETFEYMVHRHGTYGNFVCYPKRNDDFLKPNKVTTKIIESMIADKLLGAYYYDRNHVNQQGPNLFPHPKNATYGDTVYSKSSLLCDYRGYLWCNMKVEQKSNKDIQACSILDPDYIRPRKIEIEYGKTITIKKEMIDVFGNGTLYNYKRRTIPFKARNLNYELIHNTGPFHLDNSAFIRDVQTGTKFGTEWSNVKTLRKYKSIVPDLILSYKY